MPTQVDYALAAIKAITVAVGLFIVWLGVRAYRKQPQRTVFWLTAGILVLTIGAVSEGAAFQALKWTLDQSHVFEAVVTLLGFAILLYSLYVK